MRTPSEPPKRPPFKVAGVATIKHLNFRKEGPVLDACMTCLSDDAALLHGKNPEDEVADNMLKAEELMREMADLLAAVLGNFTRDDDLPDNLLPRIHAVLYRT